MPAIVVATDLSAQAEAAFVRALSLARARHAELIVVSADTTADLVAAAPDPELVTMSWGQLRADVAAEEERLVQELVARAKAAEVTATSVRQVGDPVELVVSAAREHKAELIVVGSHGRTGIRRFLLGSVAERIVRTAPTSVLVARGDGHSAFLKVLVAHDFSPLAARALSEAQALAAREARVTVVHAWHYPAGGWSMAALGERSHAIEALESALTDPPRARGEALVLAEREAGRTIGFRLLHGQAGEVVTDLAAAEHSDLIAIGTHGHRGVRRLLLGSVAAAVVRHAPCSVLVSREPAYA